MPANHHVERIAAEFIGTFSLTLIGCGSAVVAANFVAADGTRLGIGLVGVALAFGLIVTAMIAALGHISGGHFNPAVSIGLAVAGRIPWRQVPGYIASQVAAGITASAVLFTVASGRAGFSASASGFASNGYGKRSPDGYSLPAAMLTETILTALFVFVILCVTADRVSKAMAPVAIGVTLTVIHLMSIPVTNTSVNPARSIGPALFAGTAAIGQLWLFATAPIIGAVLAGICYSALIGDRDPNTDSDDERPEGPQAVSTRTSGAALQVLDTPSREPSSEGRPSPRTDPSSVHRGDPQPRLPFFRSLMRTTGRADRSHRPQTK